jgi:hypothetical protein
MTERFRRDETEAFWQLRGHEHEIDLGVDALIPFGSLLDSNVRGQVDVEKLIVPT